MIYGKQRENALFQIIYRIFFEEMLFEFHYSIWVQVNYCYYLNFKGIDARFHAEDIELKEIEIISSGKFAWIIWV